MTIATTSPSEQSPVAQQQLQGSGSGPRGGSSTGSHSVPQLRPQVLLWAAGLTSALEMAGAMAPKDSLNKLN